MAIDLQKCWQLEGCADCIAACHSAHNVPSFPDVKEEVKWIWTVPYEKVFPDQDTQLP